MREKNKVNPGEIVQIHGWIGSTGTGDPRAEMDMITGVKEVGLEYH